MNPFVQLAVTMFIKAVLGSDVFTRIEAEVHRWAEKRVSGATKREGIVANMEVIGIQVSEWVVRLAIELAVGKMRNFEKEVK